MTAFKDRARIIAVIVAVFMVFLLIIGVNAYTAKLQYEINSLSRQIQESERQIQNLEVRIKSATNITNLESRALELGLIYPDFDQIVYYDQGDADIEEFALALMETIYR
ncbi:MAG: hypothetical protein II971_02565 [Firmicutes bacterium]|nr:hypothetical protein [Bacillota bacterium]